MMKMIATNTPTKTIYPARHVGLIAGVALTILLTHFARGAVAPLVLGAAGNYVILAKSGISTVPTSAVTGNLGVSPIDSTAVTGFSSILDGLGQFATSAQVTGKIYAANYASPTPNNLTTEVSDMETAYTDAAGRTLPDFTELGSGNIGGMTMSPGLYKWSTGVTIPANVTLAGSASDVWIFQIAGNLTLAAAKAVTLSGGAQARNIFWQVAGGAGVDLGTTSHFEGTILAAKAINLQTGASINGRLLSQTAVTLDANTINSPSTATRPSPPSFGPVSRAANGTVTLSITNTPGLALTLQHSSDLTLWSILATPTPSISPFVISDTTTGTDPIRFYRAFYP